MLSPNVRTFAILVVGLIIIAPLGRAQKAGQADPRQRKIAFDSNRDGHREIYVMDSDGSHQQRLTHTLGEGKYAWLPAWSPDRKKIAFNSNRDGNAEIYLMDSDGSHVQRLTNTAAGKELTNPVFSPDGKRIAFASNRDGKAEVYVVDQDGSNLQQLTHTPGQSSGSGMPDWSPDGKKITFVVAQDAISAGGHTAGDWEKDSDIYVMNIDGTNLHRLTRTPGWGNFTPRWSPDGGKVIFSSNRGRGTGKYQVYVMDADGSNLRRLPKDGRPGARPYWSPDGKKIVFCSANGWDPKDSKNTGLYVMDADGSNVRRLSADKTGDCHPAW